jgi:ParB family transcriptional regulator, chromosome partitioning protein
MTVMDKPKNLGRGLSALLSSNESYDALEAAQVGQFLSIDKLIPSPFQPRKTFDSAALDDLTTSIRQNGVLQPLLVRLLQDERYEIIAGERRFRAAIAAGLKDVPVIIKALSDREALEIALLENIQRQDLDPIEEAEGYQRLIQEFHYTHEQLAVRLSKSRSYVSQLMRILTLPETVIEMVRTKQLSMGHARSLLNVTNQHDIANHIVQHGLSVRQTEDFVKVSVKNVEIQAPPPKMMLSKAVVKDLERQLKDALYPMNVKILRKDGAGGVIHLTFDDILDVEILAQTCYLPRKGQKHTTKPM